MKKKSVIIVLLALALSMIPVVADAEIDVYRFEFSEMESVIDMNERVTWTNQDPDRFHMIACYESVKGKNTRIFTSDRIFPGQSFSAEFYNPGTYLCVDPVFGTRSTVEVQRNGIPQVTGAFIAENNEMEGFANSVFLLTIVVLVVATLTLLSQQGRLAKQNSKTKKRVKRR